MSIQVQGTTVIDSSRQLANITNLRTVGGQSILGTGDISANGSRAVVDYSITGTVAYGSGSDEIWNFTFSSDYVAANTTSGFVVSSSTLPSSQEWVSVDYGDGTWVAVARNTSTYAYSDDGVVWTDGTLPRSSNWNRVSFSNGRWFVLPGQGTSSTWLATSTSPVSGWEMSYVTVGGTTYTLARMGSNVIYGGGRWFLSVNPFGQISPDDPGSESIVSSTNGTTWVQNTLQTTGNYELVNAFYDSLYDYYLFLSSNYPGATGMRNHYKVGSGTSWIYINPSFSSGTRSRYIKINQLLYCVGLFTSNWALSRFIISTPTPSSITFGDSVSLSTTLLTGGEQVTDFKYLDNKFVILTNSNKLFYCISSDGVTPSVFTMSNWVMVQLTTSTTWASIVYGAADQKSVAIAGPIGGSNFALVTTGSPIETRYELALPNHGVYSTITNLVVRPPIGVTPTQQANLLGSTILSNRPTYTITYPSAGQVQVDTNSGGNIGDVILTMTAPPASGSLNLVVNQGGGSAQQDVITLTDPGNSQTYTYSPSLSMSRREIANRLSFDQGLTNWQMQVTADSDSAGGVKLTLTRYVNGFVTTATTPTIVVTTTGTNSTLSVTRFIRSQGA